MVAKAGGKAIAMTGDAGDESLREGLHRPRGRRVRPPRRGLGQRRHLRRLGAAPRPAPDYWAEILRVNLIGPFLAVKHASK